MPLAQDLTAYLDGSTALARGTNLFLYRLPETAVASVALSFGLGQSEVVYGAGLPAWDRTPLSVTCRSTAPAGGNPVAYSSGALNLAQVVYELLGALVESTVGSGRRVTAVCESGAPAVLGWDEKGRALVEQEWTVHHRPSTGDY